MIFPAATNMKTSAICAYLTNTYEQRSRTENPCIGGSDPPLALFVTLLLSTPYDFLFFPDPSELPFWPQFINKVMSWD
jgi:hypothetical protein